MRCTGAILIWVCLVAIGIAISTNLKNRLAFLDDITYMLRLFSYSISYYRQPLTELISDFYKNERPVEFIKACVLMLEAGTDFPEAWSVAVRKNCPYLKKEERTKLIEYGRSIGKSDIDTQKAILDTYCVYFDKFRNKASEDYYKYNRTVIASGFFLGCGLFILLI